MGENLIPIPDQVIEQLRCSQCEGYLSCGPVRLLPDGTSICGQCSPPNSNVIYRELILEETILKNVAFPCRFKMNGCRNNVAFGQVVEHESKCIYQSHHCPLSVPNDETCCWSGLGSELLDHLTKNHSSRLLEAANFIVQVDQNCRGIFGMLKDDLVLFVTYLYQTSTHNLNYDVSYFSADEAVSATYKIDIENNEIPNCYFSLKENQCPIFNNCFNKLNNMLNLNKYMEALDNPNSIKINIILKGTNLKKLSQETVTKTLTVDHVKLASLRCMKCRAEYLVFPIFDVGQNKTVCCKCASAYCNRKASTDMKLRQRIAETNFPCRWQDCNFIGTGDIIRTHEISCQFQDYCCPICCALIKAPLLDEHLLNYTHTENLLNYERIIPVCRGGITLNIITMWPNYVYIIENNEVIIVKNYKISNTCMGELLLGTGAEKVIVHLYETPYPVQLHKTHNPVKLILSEAIPKVNYTQMFPNFSSLYVNLSTKL